MTELIEARGWKEIRQFVFLDSVKHKTTMKKILKRVGILIYDGKTPVVNIEAYKIASMKRHVTKKGANK